MRINDATSDIQNVQNMANNGTWAQKLETGARMGSTGLALNDVEEDPRKALFALTTQKGQNDISNTSNAIKSQGGAYGSNANTAMLGGAALLGGAMFGGGGGGGQGSTVVNNHYETAPHCMPSTSGDPYRVKNFNPLQYA